MYNIKVRYPDFFDASDTTEPGTARFHYIIDGRKELSLVMFVEPNDEGWTVKGAVENLTDSTTKCVVAEDDYYILSGTVGGLDRYEYLEKCYLVNNNWINYTIYFRPQYKAAIGRLLDMLYEWGGPNSDWCVTGTGQ